MPSLPAERRQAAARQLLEADHANAPEVVARAVLQQFTVKGFRSIAALKVTLPQFCVLVGPNGAGKTNVIDALKVFGEILSSLSASPLSDLGWHATVRRRQRESKGGIVLGAEFGLYSAADGGTSVGTTSPSLAATQVASVTVEFGFHRASADGAVIFKSTAVTVRDASSKPVLRFRAPGAGAQTNELEILDPGAAKRLGMIDDSRLSTSQLMAMAAGFFGLQVGRNLPLMLLLSGRISSILEVASKVTRFRLDAAALRADSVGSSDGGGALAGSGAGLALAVERMRGTGKQPKPLFRKVLQALQSTYSRIEDVIPQRVSAGRVLLQFKERGIAEPLDQASMSDGVLHALALYIALFEPRAGILAIEEPENAIHPWSLRKLVEAAQDSPNRVILTTHSETVVNAIRNPQALFIVEQGDAGTTIERSLAKEEALAAILSETGQRLGEVWMDGSLGGVPR